MGGPPLSPYQEITTDKNAEIHGNLRDKTWGGLQTLRARERFLRAIGFEWAADSLESFNRSIMRTSGSIDGQHRESTTQAVQGQKAPPMALVAPMPQQAPANGHASKVRI